jgi:hypothetical protein
VPPGEKPKSTAQTYDDLRDHLRAKEQERAIEVYYQLLSSGRPLSEIIAAGAETFGSHDTADLSCPSPSSWHPDCATQLPPAAAGSSTTDEPAHEKTSSPRLQSIPELLIGHVALIPGDRLMPSSDFRDQTQRPTVNTSAPDENSRTHHLFSPLFFGLICAGLLGLTTIGIAFVHRLPFAGTVLSDMTSAYDIRSVAEAPPPAIKTAEINAVGPQSRELKTVEENKKETDSRGNRIIAPSLGAAVATESAVAGDTAQLVALERPSSNPAPAIPSNSADQRTSDLARTAAPVEVRDARRVRLQKDQVGVILARGDALFMAGDVTAARLFYHYGADAGDDAAALRLAESFDPVFLQRAKLSQVRGDMKAAAYWYTRASELGNADAKLLLNELSALEK